MYDGRPMDCTLEGVTWWRRVRLEVYSRPMLAGVVTLAEAPWAALRGAPYRRPAVRSAGALGVRGGWCRPISCL